MPRFENITIESIKQVGETPEKEINRRRIQLWLYRYYYYILNSSLVSDFEYDKKEIEYKLLREYHPNIDIKGKCPLECVGYDVDPQTELKINQLVSILKKDSPAREEKNISNLQLSLF